MIEQAFLVDIYDSPRDVQTAFVDSVELNGNPFYYRWRIDNIHSYNNAEIVKRKSKVDDWLKLQGLTSEQIVIITGGW